MDAHIHIMSIWMQHGSVICHTKTYCGSLFGSLFGAGVRLVKKSHSWQLNIPLSNYWVHIGHKESKMWIYKIHMGFMTDSDVGTYKQRGVVRARSVTMTYVRTTPRNTTHTTISLSGLVVHCTTKSDHKVRLRSSYGRVNCARSTTWVRQQHTFNTPPHDKKHLKDCSWNAFTNNILPPHQLGPQVLKGWAWKSLGAHVSELLQGGNLQT